MSPVPVRFDLPKVKRSSSFPEALSDLCVFSYACIVELIYPLSFLRKDADFF
jgi:hypothetical protein